MREGQGAGWWCMEETIPPCLSSPALFPLRISQCCISNVCELRVPSRWVRGLPGQETAGWQTTQSLRVEVIRAGWVFREPPLIITGGETEAQMVHSLSEVTPYRGAPWRPVDDPRLSHVLLSWSYFISLHSMPQRTGFKLRKEYVKAVYCHPVYLTYLQSKYIMRNAGLDEAQAGIKIARRNINNRRCIDDTTLMEENKEELRRLLMKEKGKWKSWLKTQRSQN